MAKKNKILTDETLRLAQLKLYYKNNPVEFIENYVYIPEPGESQLMKLYPPQRKIIESFFKDHNLILLKSRQIGMSTIVQAIITYVCTFFDNCVIGVMSKSGPDASDFCRKVETMLDRLPNWLRPPYGDAKSAQQFILSNGCQLFTSCVSPANPGAAMRSRSLTMLVIDEAAHIRNVEEAWTGVAATLSKTHQIAEQNSIPFGSIIISTPNRTQGTGKFYYETWMNALKGENQFTPHKIHWSEIPVFRDDPEWYPKQVKMYSADKLDQELECKFINSEDSLFAKDIQIYLQNKIDNPDPYSVIKIPPFIAGTGELRKFKEINRYKFHIISVDCATLSGSDKSAIQVMEYESSEQMLEFNGKLDQSNLSKIVKLVASLCPHNVIVVENTGGYGDKVIYDLIEDKDCNYNVYGEYEDKENKTGTFKYGVKTSSKSRKLMVDTLYSFVTEDYNLIHSQRLMIELLGLVRKSGKIQADTNLHDDLALAMGFCTYVRKYETSDELGNINDLTEEEFRELKHITQYSLYVEGEKSKSSKLLSLDGMDIIEQFKKDRDNMVDIKLNALLHSGDFAGGMINTLALINGED